MHVPGFRLESLGGARQAGERFLATTVAPEGSGREAVLIEAAERWPPSPLGLLQQGEGGLDAQQQPSHAQCGGWQCIAVLS